jgi:hypothetical protein
MVYLIDVVRYLWRVSTLVVKVVLDAVLLDPHAIFHVALSDVSSPEHEIDGNHHVADLLHQLLSVGVQVWIHRIGAGIAVPQDLADCLNDLTTLLGEDGKALEFIGGAVRWSGCS